MDLGIISCEDVSRCPNNCPICTACLRILGCAPAAAVSRTLFTSKNYIYIVAGASGVIALIVLYYSITRQLQQTSNRVTSTSDLEAHLMDTCHERHSRNVETEPKLPESISLPSSLGCSLARENHETAANQAETKEQDSENVWLAPAIPSAQFAPSNKAAVESSSDDSLTSTTTTRECVISSEHDGGCAGGSETEVDADVVWLAPVP